MTQIKLKTGIDFLIKNHYEFTLFKLPGSTRISAVFPTAPSFAVYDLNKLDPGKYFIMHPFSAKSKAKAVAFCCTEVLNEEQWLSKLTIFNAPSFKTASLINKDDAYARYQQAFISFHQCLAQNQAQKLVLSYQEHVTTCRTITDIFLSAAARYQDAFVYLIYTRYSGLWCGATPEMLLQIKDRLLNTMALAGTMPVNAEDNYPWSLKEIEEQQIVADYIKAQLHKISSDVDLSPVYTKKAGQLAHRCTDISCKLPYDYDLTRIIALLHPTPAVCGMPKAAALEFINEHEGYDRLYYTGFLGMLDTVSKETLLMVNLRSMYIYNQQCYLFAGGGILAQSKLQSEFQEVKHKLDTLKRLL